MRVILFFIDGLGLGPAGPDNPLTTEMPYLRRLLGGHPLTINALGRIYPQATLLALDTTLGVPGLPQSATGQTTLFTGINAPAAVGQHIRGFPTEPLRRLLDTGGLLKKIKEAGKKPVFLNSFRPHFFTDIAAGKRFYSATTLMNYYAGLPFMSFEDMAAGRSVHSDVTSEVLRAEGYNVPYVPPERAGEIMACVSAQHDFVLFEYFLTDMVAHKRNHEKIRYCLSVIDSFLASTLAYLDTTETLLIVTSDHGNLEDLSTGNHTENPVPLLLIGAGRQPAPAMTDLTDVAPLILRALSE